jgi:enoyl-CoA hydratase/carnithine racemase
MPHVLQDVKKAIGILTLNRPEALNATSFEMATVIAEILLSWEKDPNIRAVVIKGEGRAFCSGGDIRAVYHTHKQANWALLEEFYLQEYGLNRLIYEFPKPFIALASGITMGGGLGLTLPASFRVVTETSLWAMPETAIGFFPDIGSMYYLTRCPGYLGLYLALTGYRMNPADSLYVGLATHYMPQNHLPHLLGALENASFRYEAQDVLADIFHNFSQEPEILSDLRSNRQNIDRIFSESSVDEIMKKLEQEKTKWAYETLDHLHTLSPLSLKIAFAFYKEVQGRPFREVNAWDYHLSQKFLHDHDFMEGIRALLIDKDKSPHWIPESLENVSEEKVESYFR